MKSLLTTFKTFSWQGLQSAARGLVADSARQDILATVKVSLVLYENTLINTANGEYRELKRAQDEPRAAGEVRAEGEEPVETPEETRAQLLARYARQLVSMRDEAQGILLLLPPSEFLSTRFSLALTGENLLRSSLKLQAHTLIPAYEDELLLAVNASKSEGVALWYPAHEADALFEAFAAQGLFLAAIEPRTLALPPAELQDKDLLLVDEDGAHICQMEIREGAIRAHHVVTQTDLQQEEFAQQWQSEIARVVAPTRIDATSREFWHGRRQLVTPLANYCFLAKGAEQYGRNLLLQKQKRFGAMAAGVFVALLFLPFVINWLQIAILEMQVASLREESAVARQSQAAVYAMEDEWGVIADFPRQNVSQILLTLNQLMSYSLTSFSVDKGVVNIVGHSQDPALLVEQLSEVELFYDVGQSRSSSGTGGADRGDRFGIRMNLNGVDFPAYEAKYPSPPRR